MENLRFKFGNNIITITLLFSLMVLSQEIVAQCSIKAMSSDSSLVCGGSATLFIQADWQQVSSIPFQKLYSISSPQKDLLFLGADSGKVYKTSNGGISFTQLNPPYTNGRIRDLWFFNQQKGLLFTDSAKIFKTSNGGDAWQEILFPLTVPDSVYIWTQRAFNTVSFSTPNIGFAGGNIYSPSGLHAGILYKTTDAGNTWTPVSIPNLKTVEKIYFIDSLHGFIGTNGKIYKTSNGGTSWSSIYEMQYLSFNDFTFINKDTGFVETNGLMRTFDGGTTWTVLSTPDLFSRGINKDQYNAIYVMYNSTIYKSVNLGNTWVKLNINPALLLYSHYLQAIDFSHGNSGLAVGLNNNAGTGFALRLDKIDSVLWLKDNGLNDTTSQSTVVSPNLSTTYFVTAYMGGCSTNADVTIFVEPIKTKLKERYVTACDDSLILNPEVNFTQKNNYTFNWQPALYLNNPNLEQPTAKIKQNTKYSLIINSYNGCTYTASTNVNLNFNVNTTEDFFLTCGKEKQLTIKGAGWTKQSVDLLPSIINPIRGLAIANFDTVYLYGDRRIWRSNKEGKNWQLVYDGHFVYHAHFRNAGLGFVTAFDAGPMQGVVLKTTDGGATWTSVNLGNVQLGGIFFTSDLVGYTVGNPGKIFKTTNGGNTWLPINVGTGQTLNNIYFPSSNIGYAVGSNGTVLKTINAGLNWFNLNAPISREIKSVYFSSADTGFVGSYDTIWRTNNGGSTWMPFALNYNWQSTYIINDIKFVDAQNGFLATEYNNVMGPLQDNGAIFQTNNGGISWQRVIADSTGRLISIFVHPSGTGFAVGGSNHFIFRDMEAQNYLWSPTVGLNQANIKEPIAKPITNTTYTVKAYRGDCFVTDSVNVMVSAFMKTVNKNIQVVCGDSFTFSQPNVFISIDAAQQYLSYWEIFNEQGIQIIRSTSDSLMVGNYYLSPGNYTFKWHRIGPSMHNIIRIIPFIGDSVSEEFFWTPDTVLIRNFSVGSTQNYTYQWSPTQTLINPNTPVKSYGLLVTSPDGCKGVDSLTITPKAFRIKIDGYNYGAVYGPMPCGASQQLDSTLTNYTGKGILSYNWSEPSLIEDTTSLYPKVFPNKSGFVTLRAQTPNGCMAADSVQFVVEPMFLQAKDTSVSCKTSFKPTIFYQYAGSKPLQAIWEPNIELDSANVLRPIISPSANRSYLLKVSSWNGCIATDSFKVTLRQAAAPSLCLVGVGPDNKNQIIWNKSQSLNTEKFYLYKETNITDQYNLLAEVNPNADFIVIDSNSNPIVQSYKYKLAKLDVCGLQSDFGTAHKTMHLTINKGAGNNWNLIWNSYEGFTVSTYNIYRGSTENNLQLIGTSSGSNNSYTDQNAPIGDVYYQVEIVSQNPCSPSKTYNTSRSNIMSNKFLNLNRTTGIENVLVYPNPTTDKLMVSFDNKNNTYRLQLLTMMGEVLIDQEMNEPQSNLSLASFAPGTYVLLISNAFGKTERLVVKH